MSKGIFMGFAGRFSQYTLGGIYFENMENSYIWGGGIFHCETTGEYIVEEKKKGFLSALSKEGCGGVVERMQK